MRLPFLLSTLACLAITVIAIPADSERQYVRRRDASARQPDAIKARQWSPKRRSTSPTVGGALVPRAGPSTVPGVTDLITLTYTTTVAVTPDTTIDVTIPLPIADGSIYRLVVSDSSPSGRRLRPRAPGDILYDSSGSAATAAQVLAAAISARLYTGNAQIVTFTATFTAPTGTILSSTPATPIIVPAGLGNCYAACGTIICPTGATPYGLTCLCSSGTFNPASRTCIQALPEGTCPDGTTVLGSTCACPIGTYDAATRTCIVTGCNVGSSRVQGVCTPCRLQGLRDGTEAGVCGSACPIGAITAGNSCTCADGSIYVASTNTCQSCNSQGLRSGTGGACLAACPAGATSSGPTCVCGDGSTFVAASNQCVTCSTIGAEPGIGGQCGTTCPPGSSADAAGCRCSDGSVYDPTTKVCSLCNSIGRVNGVGGACGVICPSGATASGTTCVCPSGFSERVAGVCTLCSVQLLRDGTGGSCGPPCPPETTLAGTTCLCPSGSSFDATSNSCSTCNAQSLRNGVDGACGLACPAGSTAQGATCICNAVGESFVGGACATCASQMLQSSTTAGVCGPACPVDATLSAGSCVCATTSAFVSGACVTCDSLNQPNGDGSICGAACTGNQGRLGGACVDCNAQQLRAPSVPGGVCQASCTVSGAVPTGSSCSCPGLSQVNDAGNACESICNSSGLPDSGALGTCAAACPAGSGPVGAACPSCDSQGHLASGPDGTCLPACADGFAVPGDTNGACTSCESQGLLYGTGGTCGSQCGPHGTLTYATPTSSTCVCDSGYELFGTTTCSPSVVTNYSFSSSTSQGTPPGYTSTITGGSYYGISTQPNFAHTAPNFLLMNTGSHGQICAAPYTYSGSSPARFGLTFFFQVSCGSSQFDKGPRPLSYSASVTGSTRGTVLSTGDLAPGNPIVPSRSYPYTRFEYNLGFFSPGETITACIDVDTGDKNCSFSLDDVYLANLDD